jgi:hypothetical protein
MELLTSLRTRNAHCSASVYDGLLERPRSQSLLFGLSSCRLQRKSRWRPYLPIIQLSAVVLLVVHTATAQQPTDLTLGLTQNSSYHGGDIDLVNLGTGNLMVNIPLVSYPQRGSSLKLEYDFVYNGGTISDRNWCPPAPAGSGTSAPPPPEDLCVLSWNAPPHQRRTPWSLSDMQDVKTGVLLYSVTPTQQQYTSQEYTYAFQHLELATERYMLESHRPVVLCSAPWTVQALLPI